MTFKGKDVRVIITGDAKEALDELQQEVNDDGKCMKRSSNHTLLDSINDKILLLKENPQYGVHIPKDRIPKEYIIRYDVENLWKINLAGAWRMIYTIRGSEVEIISLILDIFDHEKYENLFRYRHR
jgi:hypothetical protein